MKKLAFLLIILAFTMLFGCTFNSSQYINLSKKPSNNYYTAALYTKLENNENYTIDVFDTNVYKNITISNDENHIIKNFILSLNSDNYNLSSIVEKKEPYRMQIIFDDGSRYLIKVFDNNYAYVSPWDGIYDEDHINMSSVPLAYNLFDFCNHIHNHNNVSK